MLPDESIRAESRYFSRASGASNGGTSLIGATNLSPVTKLKAGTGAVSRYKLSRSQKAVTVQDFNCGQMRVSGCKSHYKFVLGAGAKAKTVTSLLIIPSVLCIVFYYLFLVD